MTKSIVACVAGALLLAGCGDDHSYPDGFAAQAAREEKDFVQAPRRRVPIRTLAPPRARRLRRVLLLG